MASLNHFTLASCCGVCAPAGAEANTWARDMSSALIEIGTLIARDAAVHGGRPLIAGTGVSVRVIAVDSNSGLSPEEIAADRPDLSLAQVFAALAYYHANKADIDADIDAEARAYENGSASSSSRLLPA